MFIYSHVFPILQPAHSQLHNISETNGALGRPLWCQRTLALGIGGIPRAVIASSPAVPAHLLSTPNTHNHYQAITNLILSIFLIPKYLARISVRPNIYSSVSESRKPGGVGLPGNYVISPRFALTVASSPPPVLIWDGVDILR
jgi:hypothetical protein